MRNTERTGLRFLTAHLHWLSVRHWISARMHPAEKAQPTATRMDLRVATNDSTSTSERWGTCSQRQCGQVDPPAAAYICGKLKWPQNYTVCLTERHILLISNNSFTFVQMNNIRPRQELPLYNSLLYQGSQHALTSTYFYIYICVYRHPILSTVFC